MRPIRLQIQGFTCYREKQEIDFSKLGLFAIAGPTGAGKSSILDAIAFSLYGKIPRLGGQNLDEFISLGAPSATVLFEFDLQQERYRVVRTMRRNGSKKVSLEQISTGVPKPLCDSVTEANAMVESLLGLEYNAFIQSVLLPQGEFAKFLQSKPNEQRQILRELLRLSVYERMRKAASERATALSAGIASDRKLLDGHYAEATPARVAELEENFSALQCEKEKADRQRDKLQERLREIQDSWKLVQERQRRGGDLQKLHLDQPRIASLRETVSRAKQAALILPVLNEAVAKANAFKRFEQSVPDLEQRLNEAANALQQSETRLQNARLEAGTIPGKQQRVHELTKILPVLTERKRCVSKLGQLRTGLEQSVRNVKDKGLAFDRESKAKDEWNDRHATVLKRLTELNYDVSIHAVLKDAQKLAFDVQRSAKDLSELNPEQVQAVVRQAELAFDEATQHLAAVEDQQRRAEDKHAAAETECEAARDKERAAVLRLTLSQGCPCPVCEQPVHEVPAAGISSDVNAATRAVETAKKARDAAIRAANMAREKFSKAQVQVENARNEAVKWEERATRVRKELRDSSEALAVAIKPLECPNGKRIHEFAIQELTRQEKVHAQWQSLANELNQAALQAQRAESKAAAAAQALETERQNGARLTREIEEAERQIAEYDRDTSTVGASDPERERGTALDQIAAIEQEVKTATELRDRLSNEKNQAELKTTEAKAHMAAAAEQRRLADKAAEESLRAADFASVADVKAATLPASKIEASENEIAEFDTALNQTVARIGELDHQLKRTKVTEADVTRASEEAKQAQDAATSLAHQIGACENRLKSLRDDTTKAELLRAEHAERTSQHAVLYQLSQDLKGDCFQQYLLEGSFRRLVSGASRRLRDLNERYELTFGDGKFAVVDHDHGSLTRLADTLSGGETFLVSLSLALELSEQVQQAAGAVRLDSLFIDEGFGTLDPETLGTVADAIESLSKTNRMVGVITHVAELHSRLPRLEVRPNGSGSTVQYVED